MINTYNETSLHKTLKTIYSLENEGSKEEQKILNENKRDHAAKGEYIFDIVTNEGNVIEIQTGNLGHLLAKIEYLIAEKRKVTVVYPLATTKYIQTNNRDTHQERRRKSPSSAKILSYKFFRELTTLAPILLNKYFTLEVLSVTMTEERISSEKLIDSTKYRRRFRKNWVKSGKHLDSIDSKTIFHGKKSWISLLPKLDKLNFTVNSLLDLYTKSGIQIKRTDVQLIVWVYSHMGLFELIGKEGKSNLYCLKK